MLFVKVLAGVGAVMGIYSAAALQNGPDVTDANLCKLLRRISASIPDQCIPSLDDWGTLIAAIIVLVCMILLLWDFRKHVFVSRGFMTAVKRLWAKVDPYLIPIGLGIIIFGAVVLAYGAYKQSAEAKFLRKEFGKIESLLATAQRPKSPTTRLVQEQPPQPAPQQPTPAGPPARVYEPVEKGKLKTVLIELSEIINRDATKVLELSRKYNSDIEDGIGNLNAKARLEKMRDIEKLSQSFYVQIYKKILPEQKYFAKDLNYVVGGDALANNIPYWFTQRTGPYIGQLNMAVVILQKTKDDPSVENQLLGMADAEHRAFMLGVSSLELWVAQTNSRIDEKTKELQ